MSGEHRQAGNGQAEQAGGEALGRELPSGFDYRPVSEFRELELSPEARQRVLDKIESSEDARRRAWATADRHVYGGDR